MTLDEAIEFCNDYNIPLLLAYLGVFYREYNLHIRSFSPPALTVLLISLPFLQRPDQTILSLLENTSDHNLHI